MEEKAVNNEMKAHSKSLAEAAQMPEDLPTPGKEYQADRKRAEETIERKVKVKNPLEMAA